MNSNFPKKCLRKHFLHLLYRNGGNRVVLRKDFPGPKSLQRAHCPDIGPIGSTISVAGTNWGYQETDWGPLRPQDVGRRVGVTELEREIVWEEGRVWKNAGNVVKMTNTNFKHTTSTANMRPSIPELSLLFYCLEIFYDLFLLDTEFWSRKWYSLNHAIGIFDIKFTIKNFKRLFFF